MSRTMRDDYSLLSSNKLYNVQQSRGLPEQLAVPRPIQAVFRSPPRFRRVRAACSSPQHSVNVTMSHFSLIHQAVILVPQKLTEAIMKI